MISLKLCCFAVITVALALVLSTNGAASTGQLDKLKEQFIPAEFRNRNFTIDEIKAVFREKCKKASGVENATLYEDIEKGVTTMMACLSSIANITAIQEEIEIARPIGELDTVFHKYCTKVPDAKKCLTDFNTKLQPCLGEQEKIQNAVMVRVATSLMGFMCAKGGDQIALFVAEEGPECLEANKEAIAACMNASFAQYAPTDGSLPDLYNLPELVLTPQHCVDLQRFEACTLHHLEQCQEITPANVAESVFKFIKNETSCLAHIEAKANEKSVLKNPRNGSLAMQSSFLAIFLISLMAFVKSL